MSWPFLALALVRPGFVQGLSGFGFGLVWMSLMPLFLSVKQAAAISTVFSLGLFSAALRGAFDPGGIPSAAYAYANPWSHGQIMAFLQVMITVSCILRVICYSQLGLMREFSWLRGAILAVPLYAAIWLGYSVLLGFRRPSCAKGFSFSLASPALITCFSGHEG